MTDPSPEAMPDNIIWCQNCGEWSEKAKRGGVVCQPCYDGGFILRYAMEQAR